MNKNIEKKAKRESSICSLPLDLLEEVLLQVLSASPSPITDIRFFRKTCKKFHETCSSKRVGKCMTVEDWSIYWHDKEGYLGFLHNCAETENTNALFLLGLEEMFNLERFQIGLHHLQLATRKGNIFSKYIMGLMLFREESSRSYGIDLLNEISDNSIYQCRKEASNIFYKMIWQKWPTLPAHRCEDLLCGTPSTQVDDNLWVHEECTKRRFCSEICRWAHEYNMFMNMRYLSTL